MVFNGTIVDLRTTKIILQRTPNARLYMMVLFITNWALTGMMVYITVLARLGEALGEGIVVLPLTIILTLPTIRGLFVESLPYG